MSNDYIGLDNRTGELRDSIADPLYEGVNAADHWKIDFRMNASGDDIAPRLSELDWNHNEVRGNMNRLVVQPNEDVEEEYAQQFIPEGDCSKIMRERFEGRIEGAENMTDQELGSVLHDKYRREVLELRRDHFRDLNDFMHKVSERALENEHEEVNSLEGEFGFRSILEYHRNQNCDFQSYDGDIERDLERVIHNTYERGERYFADPLSATWLQILEQELYKAGWSYQDEELFPYYSARDDGFIDFWQTTV